VVPDVLKGLATFIWSLQHRCSSLVIDQPRTVRSFNSAVQDVANIYTQAYHHTLLLACQLFCSIAVGHMWPLYIFATKLAVALFMDFGTLKIKAAGRSGVFSQ